VVAASLAANELADRHSAERAHAEAEATRQAAEAEQASQAAAWRANDRQAASHDDVLAQ
jgi:hypothetical protein